MLSLVPTPVARPISPACRPARKGIHGGMACAVPVRVIAVLLAVLGMALLQAAVTAAVQVDALRHDGTLDLDLHRRLSGDYTVPAASPELPTYDADGNMLTCDGWSYAWNAEDRLVSASKGDVRLEFNYDYLGRRFEKKAKEWKKGRSPFNKNIRKRRTRSPRSPH